MGIIYKNGIAYGNQPNVESGAQVNVIETVKVNGTPLTPDAKKAVDVTVPTKTSDLTNDDNVVKDANYVHTDNNYTNADKQALAAKYEKPAGGVPASDLSADVQASLDKADTALQAALDETLTVHGAAADAGKTGEAIGGLKSAIDDKNGLHAYFASSGIPSFSPTYNSARNAITEVTITLPNGTLRVFRADGSLLLQVSPPSNRTFIVDYSHCLAVDRNDNNAIKLISNETTGDYILLLSVATVVGGLLATYFYQSYIDRLNNQNDCYLFFASSGYPTFDTVYAANGKAITQISVTLPNNTLRVLRSDGSIYLEKSSLPTRQFTVDGSHCLVIDLNDNNNVKLISLGTVGNYILLLSTLSVVTGLLAPYYYQSTDVDIKAELTEQEAADTAMQTELDGRNGRHVYFASSGYPTFDTVYAANGKSISSVSITLPNGTMRIYLANGNLLLEKSPPTEKTYTVDFSHSLVVDRNDNNTIKLITNGTAGKYILLFSVASVVSGLFAPYYYNTYFNKRVVDSVAYNAALKFVFFSDIHGAERNMRRIVGFVNSLESNKIDFVLNGGDTVQSRIDDGLTWYNTNVNACNKDVLICVGNHDEWESDGSTYKPADMNDVYDAEIAPMVQKVTGIVQPTNANTDGLCYYYKDYGSIRIIVLDAMVGHVPSNHYDNAQDTWFRSALNDAITNSKSVLCVNHAPFKVQSGDATIVPVDDDMGGWNCFKPYNTNGDSTYIDSGALDAVNDFITGGGSFIGWFAGHRHKDYTVKSTNYAGQTMFIISTANNSLHELEGAETDDPANALYDCFNYIGVDIANKIIKIYRYGYNIDGGLKRKNTLCYDYYSGNVVSWN